MSSYDGTAFRNFTEKDGLTNNSIWGILEDSAGNMWFSTLGEGACRYDGETFTAFREDHDQMIFGVPAHAHVQDIFEDRDGILWFACSGGLFYLDGESFINVTRNGPWPVPPQEPAPPGPAATHGDQRNQGAASEAAPARLHDKFRVRSILEDSKGNFWFGSWESGVARLDGKKFTYFTEADGLDRNQVRKVFEDRSGTIWFDTGDGICSYDGKRITTHTNRDYSSKDNWQLGAGDLWFGEDDGRVKNELEGQPGVYRYDGEQLTFLTFPLPKDRDNDWHYKCTGIANGKNGRIWFATYGAVIGYDGRSFTFMNNQSGGFDGAAETDLHVRSIFEDSKGRLWIGNNGLGVLLHEVGKTINFTQKNGLGSRENRGGGPLPGDAPEGSPSLDRVFSIGEDSAGNIWFGLQGNQGYGAWRYDGESLRNFTEEDGLTSKGITAIYTDSRGDLWLGGEGVYRFNGESFDRMY